MLAVATRKRDLEGFARKEGECIGLVIKTKIGLVSIFAGAPDPVLVEIGLIFILYDRAVVIAVLSLFAVQEWKPSIPFWSPSSSTPSLSLSESQGLAM